jgi:hypothetical protein
MTGVSWYKKGLVLGIIVLFIGVSVSSSTGKIVSSTCQTTIYNGSLLGSVNNKSGYPIEGALVRVHFHETYEEDFSDEDGFYHVTNIPICYCLKNATCSKGGYKIEWVLLGIAENTTHDFVLIPGNNPPNAPIITGQISGKVGVEYEYTFNSTDYAGEHCVCYVNWDDGSPIETVYPTSPNPDESGPGKTMHSWDKKGTYLIRAYAIDKNGLIGPEGKLSATMLRDKTIFCTLICRYLERYLLLNLLLQRLRI